MFSNVNIGFLTSRIFFSDFMIWWKGNLPTLKSILILMCINSVDFKRRLHDFKGRLHDFERRPHDFKNGGFLTSITNIKTCTTFLTSTWEYVGKVVAWLQDWNSKGDSELSKWLIKTKYYISHSEQIQKLIYNFGLGTDSTRGCFNLIPLTYI